MPAWIPAVIAVGTLIAAGAQANATISTQGQELDHQGQRIDYLEKSLPAAIAALDKHLGQVDQKLDDLIKRP